MKTTIPPLNPDAADAIAGILIESGIDAPRPVRRRARTAHAPRRRGSPQRRGFIDLAWKLGVASGVTLLISSLGWGVAFTNHDRTIRAEARAELETEYRHQAELNLLKAQQLAEVERAQAEVARRQAAEEARYTLELEQWAQQQAEDEQRIIQREQQWQTIGGEVAQNVRIALERGESREATMELYYLARRIQTLRPDDEQLQRQFIELVHEWIDTLNRTESIKDEPDGIS